MKSIVNALKNKNIIAIDPATHSLAFAAVENQGDKIYLKAYGKINFKNTNMPTVFRRIDAASAFLIDTYQPNMLVIEQPIYIQNFQTSRGISYVVGYTLGRFSQQQIQIHDVGPMEWKAGVGYKKVSATEKQAWQVSGLNAAEIKKKAEFERKNRVKFLMEKKFDLAGLEDNDIVDAIAIGYWAADKL